jgi:hypothetical protein
MAILMRSRLIILCISTASVVIVLVLSGGSPEQARAVTRSRRTATATSSASEPDTAGAGLGAAITRFASADPSLFASDTLGRSGGRWIHPALRAPHYGRDEFGPSVSTSLFGAPSRMDVEFSSGQDLGIVPPDAAGSPEISLPSELAEQSSSLQDVAGSAGAAFVVAGVRRDTDMLIRALPFGVSVYVLFSSPHAPERITFETNLGCPTTGFQLDRRLEPGTFSYEEELTNENEEDECELYSHAPVGPDPPAVAHEHRGCTPG